LAYPTFPIRRWIWWLTLVVLVLAAALLAVQPEHPHVRQPVLALELARNWAELTILLAVDRAGYFHNTRIDFVFIAAYASLFVLLAFDAARRHWRWLIAGLVLAAATADVFENLAMLRVLRLERGFENEMALAIRQWSLTKWCLLGAVWLALGLAQFRSMVAGALYTVAGAVTLWACLDHRWLPAALAPLALALFWQLYAYRTPRRAKSATKRDTASGASLG
jgi:hypothetical protein